MSVGLRDLDHSRNLDGDGLRIQPRIRLLRSLPEPIWKRTESSRAARRRRRGNTGTPGFVVFAFPMRGTEFRGNKFILISVELSMMNNIRWLSALLSFHRHNTGTYLLSSYFPQN